MKVYQESYTLWSISLKWKLNDLVESSKEKYCEKYEPCHLSCSQEEYIAWRLFDLDCKKLEVLYLYSYILSTPANSTSIRSRPVMWRHGKFFDESFDMK